MDLLEQALEQARTLAASQDYPALARVLGELSVSDSDHALQWAAQAVWLASRCPAIAPEEVRSHYENLFQNVSSESRLQRNLAATLLWRALPGGAEGGNADAAINASHAARIAAASAGLETQVEFDNWLHELVSSDTSEVASQIEDDLVDLVGDRWLFDRRTFPKEQSADESEDPPALSHTID